MSTTSLSLNYAQSATNILKIKPNGRNGTKIRFDDVPKCIYYRTDEPVLAVNSLPKREHAIYRVNAQHLNAMIRLDDLRLVEIDYASFFRLEGFIQVSNLSYEKAVTARVSLDNWRTLMDFGAVFIQSIPGTEIDVFKFSFLVNSKVLKDFTRLELAIRYKVDCQEFWDNNAETNHSYLISWIDF